jgi:diguanylate cyclase (GGDEF)-like protein
MTKGKPLHEIIEEHKGAERRTNELSSSNAKLRGELRRWKKKARYDRLTGLLRRETFDDLLEKLLKRADKFDKPLCLLMIDVDDFKSINDNYGHDIGDVVLRRISETIYENVRQTDLAGRKMAGRYGGEELAVVLPNTDIKGARIVAERVRKAIEGKLKDSEFRGEKRDVTVSIGVSSHGLNTGANQQDQIDYLYKIADTQLYKAKKAGKNRVKYARD